MKNKNRNLLALLLTASSAFALTSCAGGDSSSPSNTSSDDPSIAAVYQAYLDNGGTLSYEEWLASIKGEKGEKGDKGDKGDPGKDGQDGTNGVNGADGSSILNGKGAPADTLGKDGDSYIDTDTFDYYVKADGAWSKSGNIKGGNGKDGEDAVTYVPCIFNNYDGSKLYEFYYEKGSTIVYDGPAPTKPSETIDGHNVDWTFAGWDKSLENIQKPTIFTAKFESLVECTFVNYDGEELYKTSVNFGDSVEYKGVTPTKPDTVSGSSTLTWAFSGWDKALTNIKEDTTFTAQFYCPNAYTCTFKNYDGTTLYVGYCGNGDTIEYEGKTPTKESVDDGSGTVMTYSFSGWDKSLKNISSDTTFTAQFNEVKKYWCTFLNYDGTFLYKTLVFGGGQAVYGGEAPTKAQDVSGTNVTTYSFSGWDKSLANIAGPTTFKAQYQSTSYTGYKVTFMNGEAELYSHYFREGSKASYPYELPYSYDDENVTQFMGWDNPSALKKVTAEVTVNAITKTITRHQNGEYPQTKVTDESLIKRISEAKGIDKQGYYVYGGERYELYRSYFYKVEPIRWKFLSNGEDSAFLTSEKVLDAHCYNSSTSQRDDGTYANNWAKSDIRAWLNDDFLDKAFYYDDSLIKTTSVDNSVASTGYSTNPYVCETTTDKIFLLSCAELTNSSYGFNSYASRVCKPTDYAIAKGVSYSNEEGYGAYYWTRSPSADYSSLARSVYNDGGIRGNYVYGSDSGVRPSLSLSIS